jgi:hypothetical protein
MPQTVTGSLAAVTAMLCSDVAWMTVITMHRTSDAAQASAAGMDVYHAGCITLHCNNTAEHPARTPCRHCVAKAYCNIYEMLSSIAVAVWVT